LLHINFVLLEQSNFP